jgi:hypothetical protein
MLARAVHRTFRGQVLKMEKIAPTGEMMTIIIHISKFTT